MTTEQKIDKVLDKIDAQSIQITTFITHQKQHRKEIDNHADEIDKLKTIKDKFLGAVIAVSFCVSGIVSLLILIFKH